MGKYIIKKIHHDYTMHTYSNINISIPKKSKCQSFVILMFFLKINILFNFLNYIE